MLVWLRLFMEERNPSSATFTVLSRFSLHVDSQSLIVRHYDNETNSDRLETSYVQSRQLQVLRQCLLRKTGAAALSKSVGMRVGTLSILVRGETWRPSPLGPQSVIYPCATTFMIPLKAFTHQLQPSETPTIIFPTDIEHTQAPTKYSSHVHAFEGSSWKTVKEERARNLVCDFVSKHPIGRTLLSMRHQPRSGKKMFFIGARKDHHVSLNTRTIGQ